MAFDASPSWSGFNYQGKVSLYHALKIINQKPAEDDLSNFSLMLENTEDFEIIENRNAITYHQVKAYNSTSYSKYANALLELTLELYKNKDVAGFIHTWKKIKFKAGFEDLKNSIKDDINILLEQYNVVPKTGDSIIEKAASKKDKIPKNAAILRSALPEKTADEIRDILNSVYNETNDALERLKIYAYDDGNPFCDLAEINTKIKTEIDILLAKKGMEVTEFQTDRTFHFFLGMIDSYIISRHKQKQEDEKITISFNHIYKILIEDKEKISKNYLAFCFKEKFSRKIDEYMSDEDDYEIPIEGITCNLSIVRDFILSLNPLDLWSYYRNFSPDTYLEHASNLDNAFAVDEKGIRYVLIKIFHLINYEKSSIDHKKYKFTYRFSALPEDNYLPSVISTHVPPEKIAKNIIKNRGVNELHYEIGNIIYQGSTIFEFSTSNTTRNDVPEEEGAESKTKRTEPLKMIRLIPILDAKDILS
ncbi:TPA: hypothetical protein PC598_000375 [Morganella morganii]|nr:hypothetical protein [Morganella morganii]